MYILMPVSWTNHPFLKSRFRLTSQNQIREIMAAGFTEVRVNLSKSHVSDADPRTVETTPEENKGRLSLRAPGGHFRQDASSSDEGNKVHQYSGEMIKNLLNDPTAANIQATRRADVGRPDPGGHGNQPPPDDDHQP